MTTNNPGVALLRMQISTTAQFLKMILQDVTSEQAHWLPPGSANPIGATYVHTVMGTDGVIHGMLQGKLPLFATEWVGKMGISEMPPMPTPETPGMPDWSEWARRVQVDMEAMHQYADAVHAAVDTYLESLTDADLEREVSGFGPMGPSPAGKLISIAALFDTLGHCGEIACLKGYQGLKGYPM